MRWTFVLLFLCEKERRGLRRIWVLGPGIELNFARGGGSKGSKPGFGTKLIEEE
jgi:hypothetical protein